MKVNVMKVTRSQWYSAQIKLKIIKQRRKNCVKKTILERKGSTVLEIGLSLYFVLFLDRDYTTTRHDTCSDVLFRAIGLSAANNWTSTKLNRNNIGKVLFCIYLHVLWVK